MIVQCRKCRTVRWVSDCLHPSGFIEHWAAVTPCWTSISGLGVGSGAETKYRCRGDMLMVAGDEFEVAFRVGGLAAVAVMLDGRVPP